MTRHLGSLRCRWGVRIAPTRALFAIIPGERLKPETAWRSGMDSNSRCRCPTRGKLYRNRHFGTHFAPKNPKVFRAFFGVQIPSATIRPSIFGPLGESLEIRACARDFRLRSDQENGSCGAIRGDVCRAAPRFSLGCPCAEGIALRCADANNPETSLPSRTHDGRRPTNRYPRTRRSHGTRGSVSQEWTYRAQLGGGFAAGIAHDDDAARSLVWASRAVSVWPAPCLQRLPG